MLLCLSYAQDTRYSDGAIKQAVSLILVKYSLKNDT